MPPRSLLARFRVRRFGEAGLKVSLPLVIREWKNGGSSSYNCTPFIHSLLTKGKFRAFRGLKIRAKGWLKGLDFGLQVLTLTPCTLKPVNL